MNSYMPPDYDINGNVVGYYDAATDQYIAPIPTNGTNVITVNDGRWVTVGDTAVNRVDDLQRQIDELRDRFIHVEDAVVTEDDVLPNLNAINAINAIDARLYALPNTEDFRNGFLGWMHNPVIHAEHGNTDRPIIDEITAERNDDLEIEPASEEELLGFLEDCGVIREAV